jgi:RNA polymerase sigma-70 factor (ECF subfamily)
MDGRGETEPLAVTYCVVPWELAEQLHDLLRRHFRDEAALEVIVESRGRERRRRAERRKATVAAPTERRQVKAASGRRVDDRRAPLVPVSAPRDLPRRAQAHADRILFVERLEPSSQQLEDADTGRLVTRFQAGEHDVFAALYMRYFDRVYSYLKVAFHDPHAAEDATQQVFTKVLEALPRYERRKQPFRAWLFVVVRNYALDELAKQRRADATDPAILNQFSEQEADDADPGEVPDWISDRELLLFIERLPLPQRQVLLLRFMLGLTNAEMAAVLNRSEVDIRTLQHRALRFLEARLTAIGRKPETGKRAQIRRWPKQAPVLRCRRFALLP